MWIRGGKVKHWTLHLQRERKRWSCVSCQSYTTTAGRLLAHLCNSVTKAEIHLVGINHVSSKSVEHVRHAIRYYKPDVVAVETCQKRAESLLSNEKPRKMRWRDFFTMEGTFKERLLEYTVSNFYAEMANRDGESLPGDEMRVAIQEGLALGANVMYMDKDFNDIASSACKEVSLWKCFKYCFENKEVLRHSYPKLYGAISMMESGEQADGLFEPGVVEEALKAADEHFPEMMRALVHERNEHMVMNLRKLNGKVVAIVGAMHVPGICDRWHNAEVQVQTK